MGASTEPKLSVPEKLKAVTELVDKLTEDLDNITLIPSTRTETLEELKIYGREAEYADPIYSPAAILMFLRHSFHSPSSQTARAALRVLANAMLLKPETRQMFVDHGFAPRACDELKIANWDNEFLISRILFLSTYDTNVDLEDLIHNHHLADSICENLNRHAKLLGSRAKKKTDSVEEMALCETLKLLFNVTHFCKDEIASFTSAVPSIVSLLWKQSIPDAKPLDHPFGPLVNSLLNLDFNNERSHSALFPKNEPNKVAARLVELLTRALQAYGDAELDSLVTALISLLDRVHESAPQAVQEYLRQALLPTAEDRKSILGRGTTMSAKLLKNSMNSMTPALREAISHLLFDISDKDASKFVENVGYGFASGFLYQNNMPIPASASEAYSTGDTTGAQKAANPITGQFLDEEKPTKDPDMSLEGKEREAERLYFLFERLKKNGVINVENPVTQAAREGRLRELDDDEVEELD